MKRLLHRRFETEEENQLPSDPLHAHFPHSFRKAWIKVSTGGVELPLAKLVRASTADREAKRNHFKSQLCSCCSQGGGETHPYLFITVGDIPDLVPWEGDFRGQPVVWVINVKTQGINSKEQLCALFILQEERKEQKSLGESDMNHCSLLSQPRAVTQHWVPGAAASPWHRWCPQMPPPSSPGSPGHGDYPGRTTGPPATQLTLMAK